MKATTYWLLGAVLIAGVGASAYRALVLRPRPSAVLAAAPAQALGDAYHSGALAPQLDPKEFQVALRPRLSYSSSSDNHVFAAKGVLQPGARETKSFMLPSLARMTVLLIGKGVRYEFRPPGGTPIVPGRTQGGAGFEYLGDVDGFSGFTLQHPGKGPWTVTATATSSDGPLAYAIDIRSDGPAEESAHLETMLRDSDPGMTYLAKPGDVVFVRVFVTHGGQPVRGVRWDVRALTPTDSLLIIPVFDDGRHADEQANDGVSVGAIAAVGPDGFYQLRAEGRTPAGGQYVVTGAVEVQAPHDLLIADTIQVNPASPRAGQPVTLTVTAENAGTVDSRDVTLEFYVGARKESEQKFDLKAGESKRIVTSWTPPAVNNYDVQLTIDPNSEPYASDFRNNTQRAVIRVR
jgi:hypothetical protein